ncbi:hypothetical protein [Burkholderia plantarii]|nr:hypothetical protein [Burkholderia plantarii]
MNNKLSLYSRFVGNMVVNNMANRPTSSVSTLYGPGGDVNAMTTDAGRAYRGDPEQEFASRANWNLQLDAGLREQAFVSDLQDQFGQLANDALAASRARDAALKRQLGSEFVSTANQKLAAQRTEYAADAARMEAQMRAEKAYASQLANAPDLLSSIGVTADKLPTIRVLDLINRPLLVDNQPGFKAWDGKTGTGPYDRTARRLAVALDPIGGAVGGAAYAASSIANYISPGGGAAGRCGIHRSLGWDGSKCCADGEGGHKRSVGRERTC